MLLLFSYWLQINVTVIIKACKLGLSNLQCYDRAIVLQTK